MLDTALKIISNQLEVYVRQRFDLEEKIVELASPVSPDGVVPVEANDKLLIFLANVTKDTLPANRQYSTVTPHSVRHTPPLNLNLHILVAANFRTAKYQDALALLSAAIRCFQATPVIDRSNYNDMPNDIEKLILDIENTDLNEASNLWGIMGGKYLPSIFYKVRMLTLHSDSVVERVTPASTPAGMLGN